MPPNEQAHELTVSVLIPTYNRADSLQVVLEGLAAQQHAPFEVIVVVRPTDTSSIEKVRTWEDRLPMRLGFVEVPGVVQAMNVGLGLVRGDICVLTDDDTHAPPDWLHRIREYYEKDSVLGALGGRDIVHDQDGRIHEPFSKTAGVILPYGRIIGNHHVSLGGVREVDHLKGVNMTFRMKALDGRRFDTTLRGGGAQVYFELAFSLELKSRGWRILFDPTLAIDHYPGQRFDEDKRSNTDFAAKANAAYNLFYSIRRYMQPGPKKLLTLNFLYWIGAFGLPGAARGLLARLLSDKEGVELRRITVKAWKEAARVPVG